MAYARLTDEPCTTVAMTFQKIRDFLCKRNGTYDYSTTGIGWTLYDSFYAVNENTLTNADYFVAFSPGESGRDQIYLKIVYVTTNLQCNAFLFWNSTTNIGVRNFCSGPNINFNSSTLLCVFGDLNFITVVDNFAAKLIPFMAGKLQTFDPTIISETILLSTTSLTAGVDRSIIFTETLPTDWGVGKTIFIWDNANVEVKTIKTIDTGAKTITVDLTNSYSISCKVSRFMGYISSNNSVGYFGILIDRMGNSGLYNFTVFPNTYVYIDGQKWIMSDIYFIQSGGFEGKLRNVRACPSATLLARNDTLTDLQGLSWRCLDISYDGVLTCFTAYREN